jgi:hypothetical protein
VKRDEIRTAVNAKLAEVGFPCVYRWVNRPAKLELLVGSNLREIPFKSGMTRRQLEYELGRIEDWADRRERERTKKARKGRSVDAPLPRQTDLEEFTGRLPL